MRAGLLALALLLAPAACGPNPDAAMSEDDRRHERDLREAVSKARAQLSFFWQAKAEADAAPEDHTNYDFMLRVELPRRDGTPGKEMIWVDAVADDANGRHSGYVASKPLHLGELKQGDRLDFNARDIVDWSFVQGRGLLGHYTTRVELPRMDPAQAESLRSLFKENP
jgi:uncharacterized protein YegJ (DUF2314 family)